MLSSASAIYADVILCAEYAIVTSGSGLGLPGVPCAHSVVAVLRTHKTHMPATELNMNICNYLRSIQSASTGFVDWPFHSWALSNL